MRGGRGKATGGCVGKREVAGFAFGAAEWEGIKKHGFERKILPVEKIVVSLQSVSWVE